MREAQFPRRRSVITRESHNNSRWLHQIEVMQMFEGASPGKYVIEVEGKGQSQRMSAYKEDTALSTIVDTADGIEAFRLLSIRGRLQLELKGLKFKPLPGYGSTFTFVKRTFSFKGNKQSVYDQYEAMLREKGVLADD